MWGSEASYQNCRPHLQRTGLASGYWTLTTWWQSGAGHHFNSRLHCTESKRSGSKFATKDKTTPEYSHFHVCNYMQNTILNNYPNKSTICNFLYSEVNSGKQQINPGKKLKALTSTKLLVIKCWYFNFTFESVISRLKKERHAEINIILPTYKKNIEKRMKQHAIIIFIKFLLYLKKKNPLWRSKSCLLIYKEVSYYLSGSGHNQKSGFKLFKKKFFIFIFLNHRMYLKTKICMDKWTNVFSSTLAR